MRISRDAIGARMSRIWFGMARRTRTHLYLPDRLCNARLRSPILLCSLPRAGSTWLAKLLTAEASVYYVHEPYNPDYCSVCSEWDPCRGPAFSSDETSRLTRSLSRGAFFHVVSLRYQPPWRYWSSRLCVIKDVHVLFSLEHLMQYEFRPLLLVRHPCAFAESHARRELMPNLERNLAQMKAASGTSPVLRGILDDINGPTEGLEPLEAMGLYWSLAYTYALRTLSGHDAEMVRYEDLADDPHTQLGKLAKALGIPQGRRTMRALARTTGSGNASYTRRDSASVRDAWRGQLSPDEVQSVMRGVTMLNNGAVETFYPETGEVT